VAILDLWLQEKDRIRRELEEAGEEAGTRRSRKTWEQNWIRYFQKVMDFFAEIHGQKQEDRGVVNHDFLLKARP